MWHHRLVICFSCRYRYAGTTNALTIVHYSADIGCCCPNDFIGGDVLERSSGRARAGPVDLDTWWKGRQTVESWRTGSQRSEDEY